VNLIQSIPVQDRSLYNNYSETRNLIGQQPCRMDQASYPARGLKCLRGILKMSLFHCSYFIKQLPNNYSNTELLKCGLEKVPSYKIWKNYQMIFQAGFPCRIRHIYNLFYTYFFLYLALFFSYFSKNMTILLLFIKFHKIVYDYLHSI
jgi:hypothetical protein